MSRRLGRRFRSEVDPIHWGPSSPLNSQNHLCCKLPVDFMQGFMIKSQNNDGYGSQWYGMVLYGILKHGMVYCNV